MKTYKVCVECTAYYNAWVEVPDGFTEEQAFEYANSHKDELPVDDLIWVRNNNIDRENCQLY